MTEEELDKIRKNFGPNNPEPLDFEEIINSNRRERWCQDCSSIFTPQERHHHLCRNCWMKGYRDRQIREFGRLLAVKSPADKKR